MNWPRTLLQAAGRVCGPGARTAMWQLLEVPARHAFRRQLARTPLSPQRAAPLVNYGGALGGAGLLHGGRVKLTHLAERFPEAPADFNLLYLVSSAPPRFAPDLVEWAKSRGVKFVWNQNGVAYPAWFGARSEELNGPMRALRQQADFIFNQSEFCRQCADRFLGPATVPGEIAFNCVDTEHFRPGPAPDTGVCRLLAAGSHHESYRILALLEAVAELVRRKFPVQLQLAGRLVWPGAEREVREKIRALGIVAQVKMGAPYRQEDAPAIYQAAHILVHLKYQDPCPTVPIEAMACGVAVIGSRSGGMPELVLPPAGVLIDVPESWEMNHCPAPAATADAVETIMQRWNDFSAGARSNAVARFSKTGWLAQHARVFTALLAS